MFIVLLDGLVSPKNNFKNPQLLSRNNYTTLACIFAVIIAGYVSFYFNLDQSYLHEQLLVESIDSSMTSEEVSLASETIQNILPFMGVLAGLSSAVFLLFKIAIVSGSLYAFIKLIDKQGNASFRHVFSASILSHIPFALIGLGLLGMAFVTNQSEMSLTATEFSTLGELLSGKNIETVALISNFNLFDIWVLCLMTYFIHENTSIHYPLSAVISIASTFLFYLVFALVN
ncbi:hypothetical protein H4J50_16425 [Colwellia sp. 6M3]|uniref:hypothetical protein n=1 Tax=Colwellia sp. 6M3 TaxID=2759849 RepID=UPI0015F41909|nr:hypothetical protein [Colwellia sp. 6M3]MBA6417596.1 hypothetical protein [Colwellia sp. 6M3]|tara:strand:- start:14626 stop:15315 length:690 start_codon:yes stop_codon:yes gene_type:complete